MSDEPKGNADNEIVNNPKRFDYNDMKDRRERELNYYNEFFGSDVDEEFYNDAETYFNGFF